jgi:hypothetical protein
MQHDRAEIHTAQLVNDWCREKNIVILVWLSIFLALTITKLALIIVDYIIKSRSVVSKIEDRDEVEVDN